jgi:hypothetical protein
MPLDRELLRVHVQGPGVEAESLQIGGTSMARSAPIENGLWVTTIEYGDATI